MLAKDWAGAMNAAQQMVEAHETAENLMLLGNARLYSGASADALATYEHALTQSQTEKPPEGLPLVDWKDLQAKIYIGRGNALLKLHRNEDALESYQRGADLSSKPGQAHFNICATLYNTGDVPRAIPACRKAAAVDPARANTWFVLGSLLFVDAKADAQGKFIISSECRQALEKYLELAPDGPHAKDTKEMLDMSAK
jgi:tetratricopeptide (TPR) repeat protein